MNIACGNTINVEICLIFFLVYPFPCRVFVGIKKLLDLIDMARQTEQEYRVIKFLSKLEEEGGLDAGTTPLM